MGIFFICYRIHLKIHLKVRLKPSNDPSGFEFNWAKVNIISPKFRLHLFLIRTIAKVYRMCKSLLASISENVQTYAFFGTKAYTLVTIQSVSFTDTDPLHVQNPKYHLILNISIVRGRTGINRSLIYFFSYQFNIADAFSPVEP